MKDIKERMAIVEQMATESHKTLDRHEQEILNLRDARHNHANMLQNHEGVLQAHSSIISGINTSIERLADVVGKLSKSVDKIIWLSMGGMTVGGLLLSTIVYIAKEMLHLW